MVGLARQPVGGLDAGELEATDGTIVGALFLAPQWPESQELLLTIDDLMSIATDPRLRDDE